MTGQAQRQARQYRQEAKETLGISFPSSFGTILITPWLQALAQAPQWIQGKSGGILIMVCSSLESWKMGEWRPQGAPAQPEPAAEGRRSRRKAACPAGVPPPAGLAQARFLLPHYTAFAGQNTSIG